MTKDELDELTKFLAEADPTPSVHQFQALYSEVLNLVKFAMIPGGWLPDRGVQGYRIGRNPN